MRNSLYIIKEYIRRSFLIWTSLRGFTFTLVINQMITPFIGLAIWSCALPGKHYISTYFIAMLFIKLFTASYENHTFSVSIYNGELSDNLLRPHPVILQPIGENLAIRLWHLIIGFPIVLILGILMIDKITLSNILLFIPSLLLAGVLQFLFTYSLSLSAFWSEKASGLVGMGSTLIFLLGGEAVPLSLMPHTISQPVKTLPFRYMLSFPDEIATGTVHGYDLITGYGVQILWIAVFMFVSRIIWASGIKRYTSVGA